MTREETHARAPAGIGCCIVRERRGRRNSGRTIEYIKTGKLRALAVTTTARNAATPDLPTVAEFLPGYESSAWYGVSAPKGTPADIVEKLNKEINAGLSDSKLGARLADLGGILMQGSSADFGKLIAEETEKWAKVIRAANLKAE